MARARARAARQPDEAARILARVWLPAIRARSKPAPEQAAELRAELVELEAKVSALPPSPGRRQALESIRWGLRCLTVGAPPPPPPIVRQLPPRRRMVG